MKEFIEKLVDRLEEEKQILRNLKNNCIALSDHEVIAIEEGAYNFCKNIVNKLAEEYINTSTDISTTNADKIRSMTDEELAEFLDDLTDNCCRCAEHQNCGNCQIGLDAKTGFCDIKKWLQSEVEGVTENE